MHSRHRRQNGQEMVQAAMTLPVLVFVLVASCWVFLWQLGLHTTQFVAQESARAATTTSGLPADPDAVGTDGDTDDASLSDVAFVASTAKSSAQNAIDRSFLRGIPAGSPCPSGVPPSGQVCFIQEPACTQPSSAPNPPLPLCTSNPPCIPSGASTQQALWVCEWYEVPPAGSNAPYKVKIVVAGWFNIGLPVFGGNLPVASSDEESIQHCRGCP